MKTYFLYIYVAFTAFTAGQSRDTLTQFPDKFVVDSIQVTGNDITESFIIERELSFAAGDTLTKKMVKFNKERIYSLKLFSDVNLIPIKENSTNILNIDVKESWYIYPVPFLKTNGGSLKDASYGLHFTFKNFRGRNETIRTIFSLGYDPRVILTYKIPVILGSKDIGLLFNASYVRLGNKSDKAEGITGENFNYTYYAGSVAIGKRLNQFTDIFLMSGFEHISSPYSIKEITASGKSVDNILMVGAEYFYDTRDLKEFPHNGLFLNLSFSHKGFGINTINYNVFKLDNRFYKDFFNFLITKLRFVSRYTFGSTIPFYDRSYLGKGEYLRGYQNDIFEGKHYLLTSFEIAVPVIQDWHFSIKLPLLPEKLTSARIDLYLTSFVDAGQTFDYFHDIQNNKLLTGYGFGINIVFIPHNSISFEYAFNQLKKGEFIIGSGISF